MGNRMLALRFPNSGFKAKRLALWGLPPTAKTVVSRGSSIGRPLAGQLSTGKGSRCLHRGERRRSEGLSYAHNTENTLNNFKNSKDCPPI
ncbi:hypothetical protein GW17_00019913 [Ensete ventricosum]|nr:hypothetical protein GW17_00019913 [Ensete ventricosum]